MSKLNTILVVVTALIGLFFGNAIDANIFGVHIGGILWGIILAAVSAVLVWVTAQPPLAQATLLRHPSHQFCSSNLDRKPVLVAVKGVHNGT